MDQKELLKILIVLFVYGAVTPFLGLLLWRKKAWRRPAFGILCFMTTGGIFAATDWGLTLGFVPYRGHVDGFAFFFAEVFALALIIALFLDDWKGFKWLPPGLWLYVLYCALSLISIINAPSPMFTLMAAFKALKAVVIFIAAYNFLKTEDDLRYFLKAMGLTMAWQLFVVLKMKYVNGIYQVPGTFEHQNSLSMFTTMIGMVFLAVGLGPRRPESNWYLAAYIACAIIQQSTLSRAGLAVYAAGSAGVALMSLADRLSKRRVTALAALAVVGVLGMALTLDTIIARFHDYGNEASNMTRQLLNRASANMLEDHPLGIGWNNFGLTINKPWPYGDIINQWEREGGATVDEEAPKGIAESHYWLLLAETGYQGLISYVIFILVFLWWNFRAMIRYRYHFIGALSLGIAMGCGANYLHSILERVLTQERNMMLWLLLLAITARITMWRREEKRRARNGQNAAREQAAIPA